MIFLLKVSRDLKRNLNSRRSLNLKRHEGAAPAVKAGSNDLVRGHRIKESISQRQGGCVRG